MHGSYDFPLVALSIVIAILASYTALALTGRVTVARDNARRAWLLGGSFAMGTGIWSMHFVAMLAFQLPVQIGYNVPLVALSLLAAMAASALALVIASRPSLTPLQLAAAATVMGSGIVTMHYTGMAAIRMPAHLSYNLWLVALSVVIAISASSVALWIFHRLREDGRRGGVLKLGAAVLLGFAITGLHYTAMTASHFSAASHTEMTALNGFVLATDGLAAAVVIGTFLILVLALLGSIVDHWVRVKLAGADALRESEERYRSVLNQVHEVFFRVDADGRWTFLNPAWTEITGYTQEETLGKPVVEHIHEDDRAGVFAAFKYFADGGEDSSRHDVRFITRNGGTSWLEVHARVSRGANGVFLGTAGSLRDVTEHRRADEALRAARETAEAASRAKSEFLSRMSHELRTPLNAILGFGQLLEIEDLTPDNRESVEHILKGGRHLLDLINEVLDMTGIEAGRLRLAPEVVPVCEVAREVLDLLRPLAAQREITLRAHSVQGCSSFVLADRQRLKQVLLNLLSNGIKYNHKGGSVVVESEEMPGDRLRISVRDTGDGIPSDRIGRLFTPFERLGAEQTGIEGTGLGLALSKRITEAMGGTIGVQSEAVAGKGTTFWIELPLGESPIDIFDGVVTDSQRAKETRVADLMTKILYVEDNLANLELVQRILARRPDIELIPCMQGELALELARLHRPHLILLDLHLPDVPGEQVLQRLRQTSESRDIPVIVVSADATNGQTERLVAFGAQGYLTKPIDVRTFVATIDDVLAGAVAR